MTQTWFRSKLLIYFVIGTLLLMTSSYAVPADAHNRSHTRKAPVVKVRNGIRGLTAAQQDQYSKLMEDGKRLLKEWMDYSAAIEKFKAAEALAAGSRQKSDVYYYLSLAYFASLEELGTQDFTRTVRQLIEVDYYRQLNEDECPPQYIAMFTNIKQEYGVLKVLSNPPGADVFLNNSKSSSGKTPLTLGTKVGEVRVRVKRGGKQKKDRLQVLAGQETSSPVYALSGGTPWLYIIGGAVLLGGAGAALLLTGGEEPAPAPTTGTLSIDSSPQGAKIFYGSSGSGLTDTGQVTPYSLTLNAGNYDVRLQREGYQNYTESKTVTAGQTSSINATLVNHTVTVTKPRAGDKIASKNNLKIPIQWKIDAASAQQAGMVSRGKPGFFSGMALPTGARSQVLRSSPSLNRNRIRDRRHPRTGNIQVQVNSALTRLSRYQAEQNRRPEKMRGLQILNQSHLPNSPGMSPGKGMETQDSTQAAFLNKVSIYLLSGKNFDTSQLIESGINASKGSHTWNVQDSGINLKTGQYKIKVQSESTDPLAVVSGDSGAFDIVEAQYQFDNYTIPKQMDNQSGPYGLAIDSSGNFYIAVTRDIDVGDSKKRIVKINRQGVQIDDWPSKEPYQIVVVKEGSKEFLFAAESTGRQAVKYDLNGNKIRTFPVGSRDPRGVAVDANGNVYVSTYADQGGGRLFKFNSNGAKIKDVSTNATKAMHIAVVGSNVYIAARHSHQILVYSTNLKYKGQIAAEYYPCGLAADNQNYLYVTYEDPETGEETSYGTTRVEKINADTKTVATQLGYGYGSTNERYLSPTAVTLDQSGNVYVLEGHHSLNFRITRWLKK